MYWIYTCTLMVFHFFYDALENSNYDCLEWRCVSALHQTFPNPFCFSAASPSLVAPWFQTKTIPLGLLLSSCIRPAVTRPSQWGLCLQIAQRFHRWARLHKELEQSRSQESCAQFLYHLARKPGLPVPWNGQFPPGSWFAVHLNL